MNWLSSIPHKIPFIASSGFTRIDDKTAEGVFLVSAGDALSGHLPLATMVVEAMAQVGGGIVFGEGGEPAFLSAIDDVVLREEVPVGDRLTLHVTCDSAFGRIFRFSGRALRGEVEVARARFYLAAQDEKNA